MVGGGHFALVVQMIARIRTASVSQQIRRAVRPIIEVGTIRLQTRLQHLVLCGCAGVQLSFAAFVCAHTVLVPRVAQVEQRVPARGQRHPVTGIGRGVNACYPILVYIVSIQTKAPLGFVRVSISIAGKIQGVAYAAQLRNITHPVQHRAGLAGQQVIGHQLLGRAKGVPLIGILRGIIECIRRQVNIALGLELVLRLLLQWLVEPSACRLGSICLAASAQCQYRYHTK